MHGNGRDVATGDDGARGRIQNHVADLSHGGGAMLRTLIMTA